MTARFDDAGWAWQEVEQLAFCSKCKALDVHGEFVNVAPRKRTYRGDGIPEDGYTVSYRPWLVESVYCRTCAHSERTQEHSARESALPKQGGIKE